jgi:hypothetical protein
MSTDDSPKREFDVYDREDFPRATLEDAEGTSNVSESEDMSNPSNSMGKPKSRRTPRREVWWLDLGAKNQSLESIKRHFENRLDRFLSSSSNSLLRHITSPMDNKLRRNLHQCPGYLREEITLASDVSKSAIISHAFPSQSEVCSICRQLVQYESTEPSVVDGEKQETNSPNDYTSRRPRHESTEEWESYVGERTGDVPFEFSENFYGNRYGVGIHGLLPPNPAPLPPPNDSHHLPRLQPSTTHESTEEWESYVQERTGYVPFEFSEIFYENRYGVGIHGLLPPDPAPLPSPNTRRTHGDQLSSGRPTPPHIYPNAFSPSPSIQQLRSPVPPPPANLFGGNPGAFNVDPGVPFLGTAGPSDAGDSDEEFIDRFESPKRTVGEFVTGLKKALTINRSQRRSSYQQDEVYPPPIMIRPTPANRRPILKKNVEAFVPSPRFLSESPVHQLSSGKYTPRHTSPNPGAFNVAPGAPFLGTAAPSDAGDSANAPSIKQPQPRYPRSALVIPPSRPGSS